MSDTALETKQNVYSVSITFKGERVALQNHMIEELYFIEDIFSPCIVGKLKITDKFGLKDKYLFTGQEIVTVVYGLETDASLDFYIYKISDISGTIPGSHKKLDTIEMFIVDASFITLSQRRISYSWASAGGDEIIKDLVTTICGYPQERISGSWDTDGNQYEYYYSPYWTTLQNINFLLPRMSSGTGNEKHSGFLFYSTTDELKGYPLFCLKTLHNLLKQNETEVLKVNDSDDGNYILFRSSEKDIDKLNKVLGWSISGTDKTAYSALQGGRAIRFWPKT